MAYDIFIVNRHLQWYKMSGIQLSEHEKNSLEMMEEPDVTLISIKTEEDNEEYFDFQRDRNVNTMYEETEKRVLLQEVKQESDKCIFAENEKIINFENEDSLAADIKKEYEDQQYSIFEDYKYNIDIEENKLNCFDNINNQSYTSTVAQTSSSIGSSIFSKSGEDKCIQSVSEDAVDIKNYGSISSIKSDKVHEITKCKCCYCNIIFCSKNDLESHMKRVHMKEKNTCSVKVKKGEMFPQHTHNPQTLMHKLDTSNLQPSANVGGILIYTETKNLGENVPEVEQDAQDRCSTYKKNKINIVNILRNNSRMYQCKECDKMFTLESNLLRHINVLHRRMSMHKCEKCHKMFTFKKNLQRHIKAGHHSKGYINPGHWKNKLHECNECHEVFLQKRYIERHIKAVHGGIRIYECEVCYKICSQKSSLHRHIITMHKVNRNHK